MSKYIQLLRQNAGFALLVTNVVLLIGLLLTYDPLGLIDRDYSASSPVLDIDQGKLQEIEIVDPNSADKKIRLVKGALLNEAVQKKGDKKKAPEYSWKLILADATGTREYEGDRERVRDLFVSLNQARRYYSLKRTPELEKKLELGKNEKGAYRCMRLTFRMANGKTSTLSLGRASGAESYVQLDEDNDVFLARANIKSAAGSGNPSFFRNRFFMPPDLKLDNLTLIKAQFKKKKDNVLLQKSGKDWSLLEPVRGSALSRAAESLASDIINWKANSFPEQLPEDLDLKKAFVLEIVYNQTLTSPRPIRFEILGRKDHSTFFLRDEKGTLYSVSSYVLNDLFEPADKLLDKNPPKPSGDIKPGQ